MVHQAKNLTNVKAVDSCGCPGGAAVISFAEKNATNINFIEAHREFLTMKKARLS